MKEHIRTSQFKAAISVNSAVIRLYWNIGEMIAQNQALFEGRNKYIEQLAADIKSEFPDLQGFSKRDLFDIIRFYLFYSSDSVQQLAALNPDGYQDLSSPQQLIARVPWGHHFIGQLDV
ncbi:DUF1016 N-terminal domain-containing protein [Paraflavitalea soli]|uniref:DUF1016 N-terminal domain-containing protein n=1 Tax=Paraflavitalea soli TaxID=2315862 RepID=UPI0013C48303|nr:DUF1016 N-terminal domain-containing protein [Paraflavitalea soli]